MEIRYFNRRQGDRFSIEKVTSCIINEVAKENNVSSFEVPDIRANLQGLFRNIRYVYHHRTKTGINHITGDIHYCILGLLGCKTVLTIHDTVFLTVKQNYILYCLKWLIWLYLPCLFADRIICISEKTKAELTKYHIPIEKVRVIYDPVMLLNATANERPHSKVRIIHIGTKQNKNLQRVIRSLTGLECELIIVGKLDEETVSLLIKSSVDYINRVNITEEELASIYSEGDIVSFPSLYEGFGMPIIEGQLGGCAVLTSNIAPMTEVGQDSVYYVDPYNVESIRHGFKELINNVELRKELIIKGMENAQRFSPKRIAEGYVELYRDL